MARCLLVLSGCPEWSSYPKSSLEPLLRDASQMMEESTPRQSAKWRPTITFAEEMGAANAKTQAFEDKQEHQVIA